MKCPCFPKTLAWLRRQHMIFDLIFLLHNIIVLYTYIYIYIYIYYTSSPLHNNLYMIFDLIFLLQNIILLYTYIYIILLHPFIGIYYCWGTGKENRLLVSSLLSLLISSASSGHRTFGILGIFKSLVIFLVAKWY